MQAVCRRDRPHVCRIQVFCFSFSNIHANTANDEEPVIEERDPDAQLLQQLFSVRNAIAAKEGLARNRIFTDEQLQEMAFWRPKTKLELKRIRGIGPKKVDRYGEAIVKCIWGDRI